ncbi:protein ROH1 [Argentina anserina]|uniref:protein ROH1 n=1 Tax=Argentina anserina TaxID=57926 RepID=UPI0021768F64|nr:protein ROH1 [Potentilla anserina]
MVATDNQSSFLNRISIRRNQVVSMEGGHDQELEDLEHFQKHVADRFHDLLSPSEDHPSEPFLSIAWIRNLLDVFLCCEAEFKAVVLMGRDPTQITKPPLDRLVPEFLDRVVKALDICNAVSSGVESVRHFQKLAEIAVKALEQRPIGEGQVRRARKALNSLVTAMAIEDKEGQTNKATERTWSFGRRTGVSGPNKDRAAGHFRALSWGMSKGWSAAKQIQAMSMNLVAPRGNETSSLVQPVYIMSTIMLFVMWILVTAVPCQERTGLMTHFPLPRNLVWAQSLIGLQDKIAEEWKKKEKKCTAGLMEEMQKMEKLGQSLIEFADSFQFPVETERMEDVAAQVVELAEICRRMEEGLVPLQQQIRELFHRAVRSRMEVLEVLDQGGKGTPPMM